METKTRKKFEIYPIEKWNVLSHGVKALYVNPTWGINFYAGMSLDVEDDEKGNLVGIGMYDPRLNVCYYWTKLWQSMQLPRFIAHNGISDIFKLQKWGFKINESWLMWDTMLIGHILDSSLKQYSLKAMAKRELGIEYPSYEELVGKKDSKKHTTLDKLPIDLVSNYNVMDCWATYQLYLKQKKGLNL